MRKFVKILVFTLGLGLVGFTANAQKGLGNPLASCNVFVPNAFTPNGDNYNEQFTIKYNGECEMLEYNLKIFDRWGRLIFETNDPAPEKAWDGTSEGRKMMPGVYMWKVSARMAHPKRQPSDQPYQVNKQGTVVLIR